MKFALKKTTNNNYRVLIDGKVHPLLCGITNYKEAVDRTKAVTGVEVENFIRHRFEPGEQYLFISEKFVPGSERWSTLFMPWQDQLIFLEMIVLECISQHDVPGEWSDEIQYLGYRFKLVKSNIEHPVIKLGMIFDNQYPRASYGQVSTDCDYYATPHLTSEEDIHAYIDARIGAGMMGRFEEASIMVDRIHRGIRDIKARAEKEKVDLSKEIKALEEHLNETLIPAFDRMGFKTVTRPYQMWFKDGRVEEHADMTDTDVILK